MWQLLLVLYFLFGTISYILRKRLADQMSGYNRLINTVFYVCFLLPAALLLSLVFPHNLNVGTTNVLFLLIGSLIWPLFYIVSFRANKEVDVSIFTIISNISPVFTLIVAYPFLKERLTLLQLAGILLLIFSGILAAVSQLKTHFTVNRKGIFICLLSALILGVAVAYERFMLTRVDFGAYLIYGWGAQISWSVILTTKDFKNVPKLFHKIQIQRIVLAWGAASALRSVTFILALKLSSASLISAASDFLSVTILLAAYLYLRERQHLLYKWVAAFVGVIGLLLTAT